MKRLFPIALATSLLALPAFAGIHVWNGSASASLADPRNWDGGSPANDPAAELSFPAGAARLALTNDIRGLTVSTISFSGTGYTISGNAITIGGLAQINDSTTGPNSFTCDLVLASDTTFYTGGLTVSGVISGAGGVIKTGGGTLTFSGILPNTYGGITRVQRGELRLGKSPNHDAVPRDLVIETGPSNEFEPRVTTLATQQIADSATVTVQEFTELRVSGTEILGPLALQRSGTVQALAGTVILGGDITGIPGTSNQAWLYGDFVVNAMRTVHLTPPYEIRMTDVRGTGGFTFLGPGSVDLRGTYEGATIIDGAGVAMTNSNTEVTMLSGGVGGRMESLEATGGEVNARVYLGGATTRHHFHLTPASTVDLEFDDRPVPRIRAAGDINLGGATLHFERADARQNLGKSYVILANDGFAPIHGTFAGVPEGTVLRDRWRVSYKGGDGNDLTFTDVARYRSAIHIEAQPRDAKFDEPIALKAFVYVYDVETQFEPTGTVTFRDDTTELATLPLQNGEATLTTKLPPGHRTITVVYSGAETVEPAEGTTQVSVEAPVPVLTSLEPASGQAGVTLTVTVRGTNFVPGSRAWISDHSFHDTEFVSPTELRFEWRPNSYTIDQTVQIHIRQGPSQTRSNELPFRIIGVPRPQKEKSDLVFEKEAVVAHVTPGASTAWISATYGGGHIAHYHGIVADSDHDGVVRFDANRPLLPFGTWLAVDMTSGRVLVGSPDGTKLPMTAFPSRALLRNAAGHFTHVQIKTDVHWETFLWVRPGVGAWFQDPYDDLDEAQNGWRIFNTAMMDAQPPSPAPPPEGFAIGDLLLGLDDHGLHWFGEGVAAHLGESSGPGVISFAKPYPSDPNESDGVARVTLMRIGGTDGTVSVNYATANDSAIAGVHYAARAGTVTFGAGEILKTIEIPLIDDTLYSGPHPTFRIVLSNPAGTTIEGSAIHEVGVREDEPTPFITISSAEIVEGNSGTRNVTVDITLNGATRLPTTVTWTWSFGEPATFVFQPGETRKSITIPVTANTIPELDRTIGVWVVEATNAEAEDFGEIRIIDDDFASISVLDVSVKENQTTVQLAVRANVFSEKPVTVKYETADGTATAGADYVATSGTLALNGTTEFVTVTIRNDGDAEGNEWFRFVISDPTNATLGRATAIVAIVDDGDQPAPGRRRATRH